MLFRTRRTGSNLGLSFSMLANTLLVHGQSLLLSIASIRHGDELCVKGKVIFVVLVSSVEA